MTWAILPISEPRRGRRCPVRTGHRTPDSSVTTQPAWSTVHEHQPRRSATAKEMARAEKVACRPGDDRCYRFPDRLVDAAASCTPKGRCRVGWIVANSGRDSWDVWLDVYTG